MRLISVLIVCSFLMGCAAYGNAVSAVTAPAADAMLKRHYQKKAQQP